VVAEMINPEVFKHMGSLPDHQRLCRDLLGFFHEQSELAGAFICGSGASGGMDFYSDLDLGFVCSNVEAKERVWSQRLNWQLPNWFHRMDADHVKSHFIIYLFEPHIHVDLAFYTMENLPPQVGGPFTIAFDKRDQLGQWAGDVNKPLKTLPDWSNVVHEEERFWTWTHYSWCHTGRGEYYDDASTFGIMRGLLQTWHARLSGNAKFDTRRLEQRGEIKFIESMRPCFPTPDRASMKAALLNMINIHNRQRAEVERLLKPKWTTTQTARDKITKLVSEI
jgi:hypothetical protein